MDQAKLRVNGARLRASLEEMAKIGATPAGGVQRLALSDEDKRARDLFVGWLKEMDLSVSIDEMGNIFGRRKGRSDSLPPVMAGSHIDSQPRGGRFDGILGVMGALEVMRTLHENKVETERPLVIVDWTNEEGSRFAPAMVASGVWAGALERDWAYDRTDRNGKKQGEELAAHRVQGHGPRAEVADPRVLRVPHRAGTDAGAPGEDHRRAEGHPVPALVRRVPDRRGEPGRSHADGGQARRARGRRGDDPRGEQPARPR